MDIFKKEIVKQLKPFVQLTEKEIQDSLEISPNNSLGDYAFPCFVLTKTLKKNPKEIAADLAKKIKPTSYIQEIQAVNSYINFFINKTKLAELTLTSINKQKDKYGSSLQGKKKKMVVEFPAPNTNKPLHIGHLRNLSIGESVSRILESQNYKIYRVNLYNDRGIHICKAMLAYQKWGKNKIPNKKSDHFVGDFYVLFSQQAKQHPELNEEVQEMLRKWEANDPKIRALWKKMNSWALKGMEQTYKQFNTNKFVKNYYESNIYLKGKDIIKKGLQKKLFKEDSDGSIFIDLEKPLGKKVLVRKDTTSLYITQDLYLATLKYRDFHFSKSIYVVGNEQDYHFQVLFKILLSKYSIYRMGIVDRHPCSHQASWLRKKLLSYFYPYSEIHWRVR
ncbi:arginine--tRNA ligase, partial [Candidatus Woesearchaeota archaeon]|nr:arginine--tRNA ligase [Candidatus Woesearchaeota archaeon]